MSTAGSGSTKIEKIDAGDVVVVNRGGVERPYKVTQVDRKEGGARTLTFDDGREGTFVEEYAAGAIVFGTLHAE